MLQKIGEHIKGWIAGVVITIVALTFVFWGLEYYINSNNSQKNVVAKVNGVDITTQQLGTSYNALKAQYGQSGNLTPQLQQQLQNYALQELVLNQALLQTAQKAGLQISQQQMEQAIVQVPEFQVNGRFSPEKLQQLLAANNMSPQEFFQNMRSSLVLDQLTTGIQSSAFILLDDIQRAYSLIKQQRSFGYFLLPLASFTSSVQPTPDQIKNYYDQHQSQFLAPEQVKLAYIALSPDEISKQVKIDPAKIRQYYDDNSSQFPNQTFEQAQKEIEARLKSQEINQILSTKNDEMANLVYTDPTSLEKAAKALGLKIEVTPWISRQGTKTGIFADPKLLDAAFSDEVLKKGNNSQPIVLTDSTIIDLRVTDHQASQTQKLESVTDQIKQQLQKDAAQKQVGLKAYEIQQELNNGKDPQSIATTLHLTWVKKDNITREDKSVPAPIVQAIFSLPVKNLNVKPTTTAMLPNGDYSIIQLASVKNADYNSKDTATIEKLRTGLENRYGTLDYQLFIKSVMNKAKVKLSAPQSPEE